jgi:hypothetical protein
MQKKTGELLLKTLETLVQQKQEPNELQRCPECGGRLHVRFEVYQRGEKKLLGAQAKCDDCQISLFVDFAEPLPLWARSKSVDDRFHRRPRYRALIDQDH